MNVWRQICQEISALVAASSCKLLRESDEPKSAPQIDDDVIRFNGQGEEGRETFMVERVAPPPSAWRADETEIFDYCKTARKPYDLVVCGALAVLAEHATDIHVHSDGDLTEWGPALKWAEKVLGRSLVYPLPTIPEEDVLP